MEERRRKKKDVNDQRVLKANTYGTGKRR